MLRHWEFLSWRQPYPLHHSIISPSTITLLIDEKSHFCLKNAISRVIFVWKMPFLESFFLASAPCPPLSSSIDSSFLVCPCLPCTTWYCNWGSGVLRKFSQQIRFGKTSFFGKVNSVQEACTKCFAAQNSCNMSYYLGWGQDLIRSSKNCAA